jgi:hypothetical protein
VASLVEVGRGRQNAAGLMERLRAAKRESGPDPAPARGLCLVSVAYAPGGGGSSGGSGDSGGTAGTGGPEEGPAA